MAIGGVNYLVPSDVPAVTEGAEAAGAGRLAGRAGSDCGVAGKSVRVALLVIDACRDNPLPRAAGRSIGNTRGLADARPARGVFTLYSCRGSARPRWIGWAEAIRAHNSVFTRIFAEQLEGPELHLGDLAVEVRERWPSWR